MQHFPLQTKKVFFSERLSLIAHMFLFHTYIQQETTQYQFIQNCLIGFFFFKSESASVMLAAWSSNKFTRNASQSISSAWSRNTRCTVTRAQAGTLRDLFTDAAPGLNFKSCKRRFNYRTHCWRRGFYLYSLKHLSYINRVL